jgi:adenine-specific DNA-methyltransferase
LGGEEVIKDPSVIERLAYRDTWEGGRDSYLDMLYPRFQLMKRLLNERGSIYVHIGPNVSHYVKPLLDEVFGSNNYRNEIVWQRFNFHADAQRFGIVHDYILFYSKTESVTWNAQFTELKEEYVASHFTQRDERGVFRLDNALAKGDGPPRRFGKKVLAPPKGTHWRWGQENIDELMEQRVIVFTSTGRPAVKRYLNEIEGSVVHSIWTDIKPLNSQARERTDFDTQKPEALLERVIKASSDKGQFVADFFCGSGTTLGVAERLARRWIGCDLGKVGIQVSRSRLVQQDAKPFLIENIGNYQREMIYLTGGRIYEMQRIILKLYGASVHPHYKDLGTRAIELAPDGSRGSTPPVPREDGKDPRLSPGASTETELVYVGYPDRPTTARKVEELAKQAETLDGTGYRRLIILAWDYDYSFDNEWEARQKAMKRKLAVQVERRMIPPDVYDYLKKAKDEEEVYRLADKVVFHQKPMFRLRKPKVGKVKDGRCEVTIGIDKYVVFDLPVAEKEREKLREAMKDNFAILIDYWAVDWDYDGATFRSEWQAIRGNGKRAKVVPTETTHELQAGKTRTIAVRVVDVFGNDAAATCEVKT